MRMHEARAHGVEGILVDERGSLASAALPLLLATMGVTLLAVGAVMSILPLLLTGAGLTVVGFALYLISFGLDRSEAKSEAERAARVRSRKAQAEQGFAADRGLPPARSPLADEAVAALTGDAPKGRIWPPLPSQTRSKDRSTASMWEPGSKPTPAAFDDGLVEFASADTPMPTPVVAAGSGTVYAPRVPDAALEAAEESRDFRVWPGARDVDRWATFTGERRPKTARYSDDELRDAMQARRQAIAGKLPTIGAILANVDGRERGPAELEALRREATRGKCSQCAAIIWAPKKRPIVLKCPGCGHKAKLY